MKTGKNKLDNECPVCGQHELDLSLYSPSHPGQLPQLQILCLNPNCDFEFDMEISAGEVLRLFCEDLPNLLAMRDDTEGEPD